jgi:hypothetical protein
MEAPDTTTPQTPERVLLLQVLAQALRDLRPKMPAHIRAEACRFWRNERGELAWLCEQLDLDAHQVHRRILARYPEVAQPRQLELGLAVPV